MYTDFAVVKKLVWLFVICTYVEDSLEKDAVQQKMMWNKLLFSYTCHVLATLYFDFSMHSIRVLKFSLL